MGQTLTAKLLERAATGVRFERSAYFEVEPDLVLGHDATIALIVDRFANAAASLAHNRRGPSADRGGILEQYPRTTASQRHARDARQVGLSRPLERR